jgi:glyoxylase-like metal-dependent hydrolase (beta-lactamase superfamily II)
VNHQYAFRIGQFSCTAISDGGLNYPVETFFRGVEVGEAKRILSQHRLPTTHVYTPYTLLYVETPSHKILIDTGLGRYGALADKLFPTVDNSTTQPRSFLQNFHHPADVDIVIITHAHADHVGGNVDSAGQLSFPNARYFMTQVEWDFWFSDELTANIRPPQNVAIARASLEPIKDRVTLTNTDSEIVKGIRFIPAPGHTPGQVSVLLESEGQQLIHLSDTVLHPLHLEYPNLGVVFDYSPEQADDSKRRICDMAADGKWLVFAHHFPPFPNLGHVERISNGWQWLPIGIANSSSV